MFLKGLLCLIFIFAAAHRARAVTASDVEIHLLSKIAPGLNEDTVYYGWELKPWEEWLQRKYAGAVISEGYKNEKKKRSVRMFEARALVILDLDLDKLKKEKLFRIELLRALDPGNIYMVVNEIPVFTVKSTIYFPELWRMVIDSLKSTTNILKPETVGYLEFTNQFAWFDEAAIAGNANLQKTIRQFAVTQNMPFAVSVQQIYPINQIGTFGNMITFFYHWENSKTMVFTIFNMALKEHVLKMGSESMGITGERVLLGQNPPLNTSEGIGSGLPNYTRQILVNLGNWMAIELK